MLGHTVGNILINGGFSPDLWTRLNHPAGAVECPVWRQTFAADRWKVRYADPAGAPIQQARSGDFPPHTTASGSLELRGSEGVTRPVLIGQRVEAAEAVRYRRQLVLTAWVRVIGCTAAETTVTVVIGSAREPNVFGYAFNGGAKSELRETITIPTGRWVHVEHAIDGRAFGPHGLSVEFEFPANVLAHDGAAVRLASVRLDDLAAGAGIERPPAIESMLARRFFQRFDSSRVNSFGRALVVNAHELHFQFTFPEMRAFPSCTLPREENALQVFNLEGIPQEGFHYDLTYRSCGSVILRATRENHGLADGFLSFVGTQGAVFLDAEI